MVIDDTKPAIGQTEEIYLYRGAGGHSWDYRNMYDGTIAFDNLYHVEDRKDFSPLFYKPNFLKSMRFGLTEKRNVFDHNEFIKCWAASMDDSDGNNCLIVDKNRNVITITASLNLANKNTGFDRDGTTGGGTKMDYRMGEMNVADYMRDNCISKVYLHVLFMYWRDK